MNKNLVSDPAWHESGSRSEENLEWHGFRHNFFNSPTLGDRLCGSLYRTERIFGANLQTSEPNSDCWKVMFFLGVLYAQGFLSQFFCFHASWNGPRLLEHIVLPILKGFSDSRWVRVSNIRPGFFGSFNYL